MDKETRRKIEVFNLARRDAVKVAVTTRGKLAEFKGKTELQTGETDRLRGAVAKANADEADNYALFAAGKITAEVRERFVRGRAELVQQLQDAETRLGAMLTMLVKLERECAEAEKRLQGANYEFWYHVKTALIEDLRRDSRTRFLQICAAINRSGVSYTWPQENNIFVQVFGIPSHAEFVAAASELEKEYL